jgi:membrane associated rhomboid family serine protease
MLQSALAVEDRDFMLRFGITVLGIGVAIAAIAALADLAGFPIAAGAIGGAIGGVVGAMIIAGSRRKICPRCTAELPPYRRPASFKQALWGGWTCPNCGCHVDRQGHAIEASVKGN